MDWAAELERTGANAFMMVRDMEQIKQLKRSFKVNMDMNIYKALVDCIDKI